MSDDFVFQVSSSLMTDPSRPSQFGTSAELGRSKSPPRFHHKLAPVIESESSDVVAIGLDRPFSDDVQVNIIIVICSFMLFTVYQPQSTGARCYRLNCSCLLYTSPSPRD